MRGRSSATERLAPLGVYVHFPWCLKKCPYCDFLSYASERAALPHAAYADAVIAELGRRASGLGQRKLASVFFGGGTPSLWESEALGRVLGKIRETFGESDEPVEVTVECNPSSFDEERARALRAVGVDRVSIGVQGLDSARLAFLGRLHDAEGGLRAVRDAVAAGVPRVSADLIFGVPGEPAEAAAAEARAVASLGVTHLSDYALTIEPGTEFGARAKKKTLPLAPDELVADSFLAVDAALGELGFEHYEISNYAKPGAECRHNLGYWRGHDYLGLGTGAWGTLDGVRYRNTTSPERYLAIDWASADLERASASSPQIEREVLSPETALVERLMLGLRMAEGVDLARTAEELGLEPWTDARRRAAEKLVARGRLVVAGSTLAIPKQAWLFADGTLAELI